MLIWRYWQFCRSKIRCLSQFADGRMSSTGPFSHARLRELQSMPRHPSPASPRLHTIALAASLLDEAALAESHGIIAGSSRSSEQHDRHALHGKTPCAVGYVTCS
jgi:hypothetical protein